MPGVAPRFSATPGQTTRAPRRIGDDTRSALADSRQRICSAARDV